MDRCTVRFLFITLFPEQIEQAAGHSIIKRAVDAGLVEVSCINPRDFATDRHRTVDDTPFGGGAGMVLKPEPMVAAIRMAKQQLPAARVIAMCPGGRTLKQDIVEEYARSGQDLILVCGHYEGFDERIFNWVDEKLSIGDYVLTGGELPALIVMDAVARFIPGVLGKMASAVEDSFSTGLLEYPQYTRPVEFEGLEVPEVLRNGNHALINRWRRKEALKATYLHRPDLLAELGKEDVLLLNEIKQELVGVGFKAEVKGQILEMSLGYSHDTHFMLPKEVTATAVTEKKGNPIVTLKSMDKQLVGQVAAKIRSLRKPEPYKGKGIKFVGEQLRRKAGKSAGAK